MRADKLTKGLRDNEGNAVAVLTLVLLGLAGIAVGVGFMDWRWGIVVGGVECLVAAALVFVSDVAGGRAQQGSRDRGIEGSR